MKRIIVVYNPHSSRYADVKEEVFGRLSQLKGYMIGKYKVAQIGIEKNIEKLSIVLADGDLVISAGGDATGVIAANAILRANKDVLLAVLPYGNFNDLSRTIGDKDSFNPFSAGRVRPARRLESSACCRLGRASKLALRSTPPAVRHGWSALLLALPGSRSPLKKDYKLSSCEKLYPLEIIADGKLQRYATCYVTVGMMAGSVGVFDSPKMRKRLKSEFGRRIGGYFGAAGWYFKNRWKKDHLPEFSLNGKKIEKASDYFAVNGKYLARVMKGGEDYLKPRTFRSGAYRLVSFWRLVWFMMRSILKRVPGEETKGDKLTFAQPAKVVVQAEGESMKFENVSEIEIRKSKKFLRVVVI